MSKKTLFLIVKIIKCYQFLISPILGNRCRYLPTCSDYFIEALKIHGILKGSYLGFKRIISCNPIKFLGGNSGLDLVPIKESRIRKK